MNNKDILNELTQDEKIDIIEKTEDKYISHQVIKINLSDTEKVRIYKFFIRLYKIKSDLSNTSKADFYYILQDIMNDRLPLQTRALGDIKEYIKEYLGDLLED